MTNCKCFAVVTLDNILGHCIILEVSDIGAGMSELYILVQH